MKSVIILVSAACLLTACTGSDDTGQRRSPSPGALPTVTAASPGTRTCESRVDGFTVQHPATWTASSASPDEPCRWFSPEPIAPEQGQRPADIPIRLEVVPHALDEVEQLERSTSQVLASERHDVDGQPAVRQELRAVGQGLLPEGTRSTQWLVSFGRRTLLATTSEAATAGTYPQNAQVLDAMMRSLRRVEPEPVACSARDLPAEPAAQPDLPTAVQDIRREIYRAAVRCDVERLAELAGEGEFTYSFGGGDDPAGFWRQAELRGGEEAPMRFLAGLLQRPHGRQEAQGTTFYAWPSAFTYDRWADVPKRDREALKPLYDEQDFAGFAQFGSYIGYRVVIAADGTWRAFVAGD